MRYAIAILTEAHINKSKTYKEDLRIAASIPIAEMPDTFKSCQRRLAFAREQIKTLEAAIALLKKAEKLLDTQKIAPIKERGKSQLLARALQTAGPRKQRKPNLI